MGKDYELKGKFKYETCTTSLSRKNDNCYSEENESRRSSRAQTEGAKLVYWNSRGLTRLVLAAVSLPHYPRGWSIPLEMRQRFRINARDRALTHPSCQFHREFYFYSISSRVILQNSIFLQQDGFLLNCYRHSITSQSERRVSVR